MHSKRFWKPLGTIAMVVGILFLLDALTAGILDNDEPLIWIFVAMVGIPAIAPTLLGYHMRQGKAWAAWTLRIAIAGFLVVGLLLDLVMGLDVLSLPKLVIPLLFSLIAWLVFSFL